jgi:hypothetical protein
MKYSDRERYAAEAREYLLTKAKPGHALPGGWPPAPPLGAPDPRGADNLARVCNQPLDELEARYVPKGGRVVPDLDPDAFDPGLEERADRKPSPASPPSAEGGLDPTPIGGTI